MLAAPQKRLLSENAVLSRRRCLWGLSGVAAAVALPGCAALRQISVEVVTFGTWPEGRVAGRYAFDRLPSQAGDRAEQAQLEAAAAQALERAGFTPAETAAKADVLVQLGWRRSKVLSPYAGSGWIGWDAPTRAPRPDRRIHGRVGVGVGVGVGSGFWDGEALDRQQALMLFVDRASRDKLVEIQLRHEARYSSNDFLPLLFEAGLQDFPALVPGTRYVTVSLP